MEIESEKWNYHVVRQLEPNMKPLDNEYVQNQMESQRFFLLKSNMYLQMENLLPDDFLQVIGGSNNDEQDEIMFWDEWPLLKGYHTYFDILEDKNVELFAEMVKFVNKSMN